jgi:hypothetical protein
LANVTPTTAEKWIGDRWSPELNNAVKFDAMDFSLAKDRSKELTNNDTLHIVNSHNLTANTKTPGSAATAEAITETEQTFVVSVQKIVYQVLETISTVQSNYDLRKNFTDKAAYALARGMNSAMTALYDDNSTQTVGVLGSELSEDNLLDARAYFRNSGFKSPFTAVVAPATYNGLLKIDRFSSDQYRGDPAKGNAVERAKLGVIYDMTFYESQLTPGTAPNSSGSAWVPGHFFSLTQRQPTVEAQYVVADNGWHVSMDCIFGAYELQEAVEAAAGTTAARLGSVQLKSKQ